MCLGREQFAFCIGSSLQSRSSDSMDDSHMETLQQPTPSKNPMTNYFNSYQNDPPAVRQLDGEGALSRPPQRHSYFGDATLEPNTGLTNRYDYALFGLALHELLDRLRLSVVVNAILTFIILFFSWWTRLLQPFNLFLLLVLSFMVAVLLVVEIKSIFESAGTDSASTVSANLNDLDAGSNLSRVLKFTETLGLMILYHPIGRILYLVLCGCLCWWIGGVFEMGLGLFFLLNASVLLYCWLTYPEFRRIFETPESNSSVENASNAGAERPSASWSYYYQATGSTVSTIADRLSEKASLLSSSFRRD
jgi:hypothetical protein